MPSQKPEPARKGNRRISPKPKSSPHGLIRRRHYCVNTENSAALQDEALERFAREEPEAARLVELRYFAGLSHQEAAEVLGISRRVADGLWAYARAWLLAEMRHEPGQTNLPVTGGTND